LIWEVYCTCIYIYIQRSITVLYYINIILLLHVLLSCIFSAPTVKNITLTSCCVEWTGCKDMGDDKIVYLLQLQSRDHEYRQVIHTSG